MSPTLLHSFASRPLTLLGFPSVFSHESFGKIDLPTLAPALRLHTRFDKRWRPQATSAYCTRATGNGGGSLYGKPVELHFLTGRNYWYQTAFCLWSFAAASGRPLAPVLFDDGSLSELYTEPLKRLFPALRVVTADESLARRRLAYPHLKKLLDLHVGQRGYRLQMDSDLLFFRSPDCLLDWHDNPQCPLRSEDIDTWYGYPLTMLAELADCPSVPERVNAGVLGLRSEDFDWDRMEYWCRELLARKGPSYFQEQAFLAMLLADRECIIPDPEDYVLFPRKPEALRCEAAMHHYVSQSRRWYYQYNWRRFLPPSL